MTRPPVPPSDEESARQKVKAAQDAWNARDPEKITLSTSNLRLNLYGSQ